MGCEFWDTGWMNAKIGREASSSIKAIRQRARKRREDGVWKNPNSEFGLAESMGTIGMP